MNEINQHKNKITKKVDPNVVPGKYGFCIVCHKKADYYCAQTKDPVCSKDCKQKNLERIGLEENERRLSKIAQNSIPEKGWAELKQEKKEEEEREKKK